MYYIVTEEAYGNGDSGFGYIILPSSHPLYNVYNISAYLDIEINDCGFAKDMNFFHSIYKTDEYLESYNLTSYINFKKLHKHRVLNISDSYNSLESVVNKTIEVKEQMEKIAQETTTEKVIKKLREIS